MSLRNTVKQNVKLAFDIIGDLKTEMVFKSRGETSYNPASSSVVSSGGETVSLYGVISEVRPEQLRGEGGIPTTLMDLMFNREDLPENFGNFDLVTVNGRDHQVISYFDDGYTVTFTVSVR